MRKQRHERVREGGAAPEGAGRDGGIVRREPMKKRRQGSLRKGGGTKAYEKAGRDEGGERGREEERKGGREEA